MNRPLAVLLCPGRGSYGRDALGSIQRRLRPGPVAEVLDAADAARRAAAEPAIRELDGAKQFRPGLHLQGRNAAELIWFATMAQLHDLRERYEIVAVAGNSLGWYTALAAAGAVEPAEGWRLVSTMARLQEGVAGGQVLTTQVDEHWRPDPALARAVDDCVRGIAARGEAHWVGTSIRLGGHVVLAGTEQGVGELLEGLPKVERGSRGFPFRLAGHGPFHTPLCAAVAERARHELSHLVVRPPAVHLIDGRGDVHTPWSADPRELLHYTLDTQVRTTFDFTASVRTAIREFNPDVLLCAAPGADLRAPVGHVVIAEGWRGVTDRESLFATELVVAADGLPAAT